MAVVVTGVAALAILESTTAPDEHLLGDGHDPATYGFDLSGIDDDTLVAGGVARDARPVLTRPEVLDGRDVAAYNEAERGKLLVPDDRVAGLVLGGEARAWPLRLLRRHELVNDVLGGEPVVVAYAPLADLVAGASRRLDDEVLELGISGLFVDSMPLYFDRRQTPTDASLWHPLHLEAVSGPRAGRRLDLLPVQLATWGEWLAAHPETTVLAPVPEMSRLYRRDPYHSYFGSDLLRFPVDPLPPDDGLRFKDRVVIVGEGADARPFALPRLAEAAGAPSASWTAAVADRPIRIDFRLDPGTATVSRTDGADLDLAVRHAFRFAWHAAAPDAPAPGPR
jgi:hypothetical protein